jgi:hypothetical protein
MLFYRQHNSVTNNTSKKIPSIHPWSILDPALPPLVPKVGQEASTAIKVRYLRKSEVRNSFFVCSLQRARLPAKDSPLDQRPRRPTSGQHRHMDAQSLQRKAVSDAFFFTRIAVRFDCK